MIVVCGPISYEVVAPMKIPMTVTMAITLSNMFHLSLKNPLPYPIILITNSNVKIPANTKLRVSKEYATVSFCPHHCEPSTKVFAIMQNRMKFLSMGLSDMK